MPPGSDTVAVWSVWPGIETVTVAPGSPVPDTVTSATSSGPGTENTWSGVGAVMATSALASTAFGPTVAFANSRVTASRPSSGSTVRMSAVSE